MTLKKMKSILFMLLGFIALVCGVAGTVLPVLPGGPFYLLAVYFFSKSSKRVDAWFKNTYIYKKYVVPFLEKKGMTLKEKIKINLTADFFILLSVLYVDILLVRIILIGLALYKHYYFIKKIKTIPPQSYQVEESQ
ncbi:MULTISPECIES: YbaN family protein [Rossellomorea]|uniref:YbaN family protein n=1 Tax=Rossellomorea TaxID=2837508 RepID=UPI001CD00B6C|nr:MULTISPECIES: YbaN family protein [Rossellomorea]MCA0149569.1 YbaN family protein [Rossellomorea vietnamensis]WGG46630.1 YbaN family protein [Rossellomorea sp. DA94]